MTITLKKDQAITLEKADHTPLGRIRLGLGWDAAKAGLFGRRKNIDLDASAILISGQAALDIVYFNQTTSRDGAIQHSGDNVTGDGDGDDEQILVNLTALPDHIDKVVFVITSYTGQTFDQVENVYARVNDIARYDDEIARYNLADTTAKHTANVIAKITREPSGWKFTALGIPANAQMAKGLVGVALEA